MPTSPAQVSGCVLGAVAANGMFAMAAISISAHHRASSAHLLAEAIATLGPMLVIAISIGRTFSNTFAGIAPASVHADADAIARPR